MKKDIIYVRTSTADQSPQLQLRDISTISPANAVVFTEQLSAWKENVKRPVFESILKQIKDGKIQSVYLWDWDRAYRNRNKLKEFLLLCKHHGVELHSYRQKWFEEFHRIPQPFNEIVMDMVINLLGWIGEEESEKKSSRVKMAVKRKNGEKTYSVYGKRWGRKCLPTQTVNRVLELHKAGKSIRQIAAEVNIYDANNNAKKISKSAVQQIVSKNAITDCP
jgi:DNA invertase Pin-like site-specific DNA recombinase